MVVLLQKNILNEPILVIHFGNEVILIILVILTKTSISSFFRIDKSVYNFHYPWKAFFLCDFRNGKLRLLKIWLWVWKKTFGPCLSFIVNWPALYISSSGTSISNLGLNNFALFKRNNKDPWSIFNNVHYMK